MDGEQPIKLKRTKQRVEATDVDMSGSIFSDVNLACAAFNNVKLAEATIHDANLSGMRISDANLSGASIVESNTATMTIDGIAVWELMAAYRASQANGN